VRPRGLSRQNRRRRLYVRDSGETAVPSPALTAMRSTHHQVWPTSPTCSGNRNGVASFGEKQLRQMPLPARPDRGERDWGEIQCRDRRLADVGSCVARSDPSQASPRRSRSRRQVKSRPWITSRPTAAFVGDMITVPHRYRRRTNAVQSRRIQVPARGVGIHGLVVGVGVEQGRRPLVITSGSRHRFALTNHCRRIS
jgi:hypothetical protein